METQKASLLEGVFDLQKKLKGMQDILEEEYGKVSVNIQDGTIKPIEDAPDTKD